VTRPKVTIRALLVLILVIGGALGFGLPALEVSRRDESHAHTHIGKSRTGRWGLVYDRVDAPFWPRYWRRLLGKPWKGQPLCRARPGHLEETCIFAHPEIVVTSGAICYPTPTPVQLALFQRLKKSPTSPPPE
jgi:hypothetical protein